MNTINCLGSNPSIESESGQYPFFVLGRVISQHHHLYSIQTNSRLVLGRLAGSLAYQVTDAIAYPVVGDWVMIDPVDQDQDEYVIHHILNRKSLLKRKSPDSSKGSQAMVANVDIAFICMALNRDFNLRRLERYLTVVWDGDVCPVVVLTKADLSDDAEHQLAEVEAICPTVDVYLSHLGDAAIVDIMLAKIRPNRTAVLLGSSGVGKSTLTNRLLGETIAQTNDIRHDGKGRHTTTTRQLFQVPGGGVVIDTPGLRELQIDASELGDTFADIEELMGACRFNDCSHESEPECAVLSALEAGEISVARWKSFKKLQKELKYENLSAKHIEHEKLNTMFGGKKQYKQIMKKVKKGSEFKNRPDQWEE